MYLGLDTHPSADAAVRDCGETSLSYGQLVDAVTEMGAVLPERALAFALCENTVGSLIGYLSMVEHGVVPVMLSAKLDSDLLAHLYRIYLPSLVWLPKETLDKLDDLSGDSASPWKVVFERFGYALVHTGNAPYPLNERLALCMSTSGSTGSPKLVRYTRENLEANARNVALAFEWTASERAFADLGMQYTMGLNVINTHLAVGAEVLLCNENPMSSAYWDFMTESRATNITGVPFTYEIFHRLHFTRKDLPDLRTIAEGGGKLPDGLFAELADYAANSNRRFIATFGTTETAARMSYLPAGYAQSKIGSIGMAIPQGEMYLIDADGNRIDTLVAEGELCYEGPNVTMGYALSRQDLALGDTWNGIYRTGDLARRDEQGFYYITGRLSRFVKLLGHRVGLDECERIIRDQLGIDCACVGDDKRISIFCEDESYQQECVRILMAKLGIRNSQCECLCIDAIPRNESGKKLYERLEGLR